MEALDKLADERGDDLTLDDVHDCLHEHLDRAMQTSREELMAPDIDVLSASIQDIREGNHYDIQEVIDELQSTLNEDGPWTNPGVEENA